MTSGNDPAPEQKLMDLAKITFDTVFNATVHLDNKAARILGAMAFLTAAAAAIFARAQTLAVAPAEFREIVAQRLSPYVSAQELANLTGSIVQDLGKPKMTFLGADWVVFVFICYI